MNVPKPPPPPPKHASRKAPALKHWAEVLRDCGYPLDVITVDWESYFDESFGLKDMTPPEYIMSDKWEELSMAHLHVSGLSPHIDFEANTAVEVGQEAIASYLKYLQGQYGQNLERCTLCVQNGLFDCEILALRYGIYPKYVVDVLCLARAEHSRSRHGLEHLAKKWGLPDKGKTEDFKGLSFRSRYKPDKKGPPSRRPLITDEQVKALCSYNAHDVSLTHQLMEILLPRLSCPKTELRIQQLTLEMVTRPTLRCDAALGLDLIGKMEARPVQLLADLGVTADQISGNIAFDRLLTTAIEEAGDTTAQYLKTMKGQKKVFGLAKDDPELAALKKHPSERVRKLVEARSAIKSWPLHISRIKGITAIAAACEGMMPIPLNYGGAHTLRDSGAWGVNLQNLPKRGEPEVVAVRGLLMAPDDCELVIVDAASIEARVTAWAAGQTDLVEAFRSGTEIYCGFASKVLGKPVRKAIKPGKPGYIAAVEAKHIENRNLGKVGVLGCLAAGTPVLTARGWIPIEDVSDTDQIWDGIKFVDHDGVVFQGEQECVNVQGVWMTADHEVWTGEDWCPGRCLVTPNQKLVTCLDHSRLKKLSVGYEAGLSPSNACAPAVELLLRTATTLSVENLPDVMRVLKWRLLWVSHIMDRSRNPIERGFLTALVRSLDAATQDRIIDTRGGELASTALGYVIDDVFSNTWCNFRDGTTLPLKLTGLRTTEATIRRTYASLRGSSTPATLRNTYDIMRAGPNRRFQAGPLLVANCGYGMGKDRLVEYAAGPIFNLKLTVKQAKAVVDFYRQSYPMITGLWRAIEKAFLYTAKYRQPCGLDNGISFYSTDEVAVVMRLPSGHTMNYHQVKLSAGNYGQDTASVYNEVTHTQDHLWGGVLVENAVQAMSRHILMEAMLRLEDLGYRTAHRVHDELVLVVKKGTGKDVLKIAEAEMARTPVWSPGLPLAAEGCVSERYGLH